MTRDERVDLFMENAAKVAAEPVRVRDAAGMNAVLNGILEESDSVYCPAVTEKEKAVEIPEQKRSQDYTTASTCVEEVFGGIAETGSLICSSAEGKTVQAGLLPLHHVAIVAEEHIFEKLDDFFTSLGEAPPTNITLETGPSKTADIELTLTIGVHGPGRLTIIVY
ncbi:MAG TPA: LUD domain-containing protein [Desulfomonilaceae bacterium]|nr:LUD domain-containing protein [Desulfomonilaceae bacterium]